MSSYIDRMVIEKEELDIKISKLDDFICSEKFDEIGNRQRTLLQMQFAAMSAYTSTLGERIRLSTEETVTN